MSKKSLIALMTAAMLPDFSHSDLGIRYAMPTQGCWTQQIGRQAAQLEKQIDETVQKDGNRFNGLGTNSVQLYNRALGHD